ncbi:MAG: tRNA pseudouridine(38-40) synthase TruA [Rubrimonas sp.]|uniref:tRNA pseudouridine(38-40) synthase TruA n=1 Tax=Rubrimonas sp. TaxID=2036015 RepID=UPI002FDCF401
MPRVKLTLEYHGGPFVGWQRQAAGASVQTALERALAAIDPARPAAFGAGRTDAGVHALAQVAHADLSAEWDPFRLCAALNHHLAPDPVAVLAAELVAPDFHARFDAVERRYLYRILPRRAPATLGRGLVWRVAGELDPDSMREAAAPLIGRHDFTTFRAAQCQALSPVKTLDALDVAEAEGEWGPELRISARARSFLHNQVRSLVGTLAQVGLGRWPPERAGEALAARDRAACGPVAPPDGLYLAAIRYPEPSGDAA